jgi:arabinofuranosyltransferase
MRPLDADSLLLDPATKKAGTVLLLILLIALAVILVRTAWMSDDAYVTFRTVDNFVHGHGLTWNTDERVQAYTNPLWMLLVSAVYSVTREIYFSVIILSILLSLAAAYLLAFKIAVSMKEAALAVVLLLFSKAFVDFSTSGLENPLTHVLLAAYLIVYFSSLESGKRFFFLSLFAGLSTLNRIDTILLYLPSLLLYFFRIEDKGKGRRLLMLGGGFLPFIVWEIFAIFYYGFPFPNSAYAKLHTGLSGADLARQGVAYFLNSIHLDPLTILIIFVGIGIAVIMKERRALFLALGILLYLAYVVRIGGDFMSGRFFATPYFLAVILISRFRLTSLKIYLGAIIILIIVGLQSPYPPLKTNADYTNQTIDEKGIADERGYYYQRTGLLKMSRKTLLPDVNRITGARARAQGGVCLNYGIGCFAFYAGPAVHVVDPLGLSDPLLARLPPYRTLGWRIGHFERMIPEGYQETLVEHEFLIRDKSLRAYYRKLHFIVSGKLWSFRRLGEIIKMNFGLYNFLIDEERYRYPSMVKLAYARVETPKPLGTPIDQPGNIEFYDSGLEIAMDKTYHPETMELSIDDYGEYRILYYSGSHEIAAQILPAFFNPQGQLGFQTIAIPKKAKRSGFDRIRILPLRGGGKYKLGYLRLFPQDF